MSNLILEKFAGCGNCPVSKENCDYRSIDVPVLITFNKSQKADNWGRLVTVFRKGEQVKGRAVIRNNKVYCASAKSDIYDGYEDFISLEDVEVEVFS